MAALDPSPELIEDCFGLIKLYSDGSIVRSEIIKYKNQIHDDGSTIWKDRLFNHQHNLHLRLYKPAAPQNTGQNLPLLYYMHAGGFCFGTRADPNSHNSCLSLASRLQALVISVDFRLAPEHRLPAALEDVYDGLKWVQGQAESCDEPWLSEGVDFGRVFVFGDSCGGNLAHHLAVQLGPGSVELGPIRVRGYVLLSPFFGGTVRTKSEVERPCESFWSQEMYDRFWRLTIPNGATTDHPLVNPLGPLGRASVEPAAVDPILVLVGGDEIMRDRVKDYASMMTHSGKSLIYVEFEGKEHGFFTSNSYSEEVEDVILAIASFISNN